MKIRTGSLARSVPLPRDGQACPPCLRRHAAAEPRRGSRAASSRDQRSASDSSGTDASLSASLLTGFCPRRAR